MVRPGKVYSLRPEQSRSAQVAEKFKTKLRRKYEPPAPTECYCNATPRPPCGWCESQIGPPPDGDDFEPPATLEDYLSAYAGALAQNAQAACKPLHVPGQDQPLPVDLMRQPYEAQGHVISAGIKALDQQRSVQLAAEMGTGKTILSQAICQGHARGGYRALVCCPPHLVMKWEREIRITLTNAHVHHLRTYHDVTRIIRDAQPVGRGWWIVSDTRAKMGSKWKPVYLEPRRGIYLRCPSCHADISKWNEKLSCYEPVEAETLAKKKLRCEECDGALWQWTHEIDRWPIASFIKEKLPGWFDYFICDEAHRSKAAETGVGLAVGSLSAACRKTIFLSGSFCGGYAWHFRNSLFRIAPKSLIDEGLTWDAELPFNERYGRLERRVTTTESKGGSDNKQSKGTTTKTQKYVRPGVMPTLFGRHLIGSTIFLSLDEVAEALPKLEETIVTVPMDAEMAAAYKEVEEAITAELKTMMQKRDKRLLSRMLHTLLGYPDHPYDWKEIGYFDNDEDGNQIWKHVVTPKQLSRSVIRAKEKAVVDLVKSELAQGRKSWVYCVMTDARDVNERLRWLLADAGLRVEVLRAKVETTEREAWIAEKMPHCDVCISHPALTETGLDFFAHADGKLIYNVPSILFYSTGYSTFSLRQASRRAWRIGQKELCKVMYLHYENTMQARALSLMARKLVASTSIEGKFTTDGLAAMGGDEGTLETALAKSLVDRLDDCDVGRQWGKIGAVAKPAPVVAELEPLEFQLPPPKHIFHQGSLAFQ